MALDPVQGVEDDHPLLDRDGEVVVAGGAVGVAEDAQAGVGAAGGVPRSRRRS